MKGQQESDYMQFHESKKFFYYGKTLVKQM